MLPLSSHTTAVTMVTAVTTLFPPSTFPLFPVDRAVASSPCASPFSCSAPSKECFSSLWRHTAIGPKGGGHAPAAGLLVTPHRLYTTASPIFLRSSRTAFSASSAAAAAAAVSSVSSTASKEKVKNGPKTIKKTKKGVAHSGEKVSKMASLPRGQPRASSSPSTVAVSAAAPDAGYLPSSQIVHRSGTASPGIFFSDDAEVVKDSAALLARIAAQLRPSPDTFAQNSSPEVNDRSRYLVQRGTAAVGDRHRSTATEGGGPSSGPRSPLDVVDGIEAEMEMEEGMGAGVPTRPRDTAMSSSSSSSPSALPHLLAAEEEEEEEEGALDFFRRSTGGDGHGMGSAAPRNGESRSPSPPPPPLAIAPSKWGVDPWGTAAATAEVPNIDEEGPGSEMNAFAAASLGMDEDGSETGGRRRRRHHSAASSRAPLDASGAHPHPTTSSSSSSSSPDFVTSSSLDGRTSNASENVLCAIDMLCDDLFACKTDVLRSFARARQIFHGSKTVMVTRLIERAHADAHGENMDLSITRRLLGDVFDGAGHEVRVSGIRSVWTNRSLEASHIEAACVRHFQFLSLANSNKSLVVRHHGAEASRLTRNLCRPFQDSLGRVSDAARQIFECIQMLKAEQSSSSSSPSSSALLPTLFLEMRHGFHRKRAARVFPALPAGVDATTPIPPEDEPVEEADLTKIKRKKQNGTSSKGEEEEEEEAKKSHKKKKKKEDATQGTEEWKMEDCDFEAIQEEVLRIASQLSSTEVIGPFAAFLVAYVRYGASRNLLSRVDVIEKLMQMGLVLPTIEEEEEEAPASSHQGGSKGPATSSEAAAVGVARQTSSSTAVEGKDRRGLSTPPSSSPSGTVEEGTDDAFLSAMSTATGTSSSSSGGGGGGGPPISRFGLDTLVKVCSLFEDVVRLVRQREALTKSPDGPAAQRIAFDAPDFILLDVLDFARKPTDHWKCSYAPPWVQQLARTFTNWEICVRTDLQTFSDAPCYVFDTILVGVVHYYMVEKMYGREGVSPSDVVLSVRNGLKKALERMSNGSVERATAAGHELVAYVSSSTDSGKGFTGDFFVQVLSQMRGVADMSSMQDVLHASERRGKANGGGLRASDGFADTGLGSDSSRRSGAPLHSNGDPKSKKEKKLHDGEEEEEENEEEEEVDALELELSENEADDHNDGGSGGPDARSSHGDRRSNKKGKKSAGLPLSTASRGKETPKKTKWTTESMVTSKQTDAEAETTTTDEEKNNTEEAEREEVTDPAQRYHKRVAMVLKEIGKTATRCTRAGNLLDLLVRVTEDVYFHYRFCCVFNGLNIQDKTTIRLRKANNLQKTLAYFEKVQGITKPISLEAVTFLVLMLTFFAMRPHDDAAPVLLRYDNPLSLPELSLVNLRERGTTTIRELRVAFPPQLSYRSWLLESDTKEKSVYRVLPSVAVKGPTNEAMLVSQAPMMRALDAISKVPWRIHKFILHIQEAMVREGYGFGKLRPAFYPLHYASLHPGAVYYKVKKDELPTKAEATSGKPNPKGPAGGGTMKKKKRDAIQTGRADDDDDAVEEDVEMDIEDIRGEEAEVDDGGEEEEGSDAKVSSERHAGADRDNESSIFDFDDAFGPASSEDGEVVGCNIKQRMQFDYQQSLDWKALSDVRSSRTHYLQALRQARSIVQFSHLYFPNSMDFRGRMYPLPGRLNHTGSDPFRALLEYADPKPLGTVGLYWLKVHLANKMGMTKLSFDERVHYVDEHIPDVIQSAESPLSGDRWWQEASEPFQCLMACKELADALRYSQGAEYFPSRLPVAVDGSYNGLQHYSAIGRDAFGAELVNLVPSDRPADAYTGILKEMLKVMEEEARHDHPVAQRCLGSGKGQDKNHIKRKTIKRPIMTQVYGVTGYGMSEQIFEELKKQNKAHGLWTHADMKEMAGYLRDKVLDSLGITFRETQRCREWLRHVSTLVFNAQPNELRNALSWTTPLGLVVRQPYRTRREDNLFTMQGISRIPGDVIGAAGRKQLTAMAPNLIHSLDATHLAMTALEMQKEGLSMMAVHDSYWTYACDLPKLSSILRQQFVHLYTQHDPLWELKEQWEEAFFFDLRRHGIVLPDPPARGDLDLNVVLNSPYFFS